MQNWSRKSTLAGVRFRSDITAREAAVLRALVMSTTGLLEQRAASAPSDELTELTGLRQGNSETPTDPTLARLLPDFHRPQIDPIDAEEVANASQVNFNGALRSLHEPAIIDAKLAAGQAILRTTPAEGGRISLTAEQADAWLSGLNDVRLAIGTMLNIDDETPEHFESDDPRAPHLDVYHWLTWMQDSLLNVLNP